MKILKQGYSVSVSTSFRFAVCKLCQAEFIFNTATEAAVHEAGANGYWWVLRCPWCRKVTTVDADKSREPTAEEMEGMT